MVIGERIKELRTEKELTQKQLAQILQCGQSRISDWEQNACEPSASAIIKMTKFFDVTTDYLLGLTDEWGNVQLTAGNVTGNNNVINSHNQIQTKGQQPSADEAELLALWKKAPPEKRDALLKLLK